MNITPLNAYTNLQKTQEQIKALGNNPTTEDYKKIKEMAQDTIRMAEQELQDSYKTKPFKKKVDGYLSNIFEKFAKTFAHSAKGKSGNLSKTIINAVLIGNILKDLATGIVSTSQSFTNPDLTKEKRLFMGSYDIMACLTTVAISYVFGPMSVDKIMNSYKKLLSPLKGTPKFAVVIAGLTTFTSIVLQSIIAKRMIAPAISTPLAGMLKSKLENMDSNKKSGS